MKGAPMGRERGSIFSDTGWEPAAVYQHLERLTAAAEGAGIPEPPWEPDLETVTVLHRNRLFSVSGEFDALRTLLALHADGYELRPIGVPDA